MIKKTPRQIRIYKFYVLLIEQIKKPILAMIILTSIVNLIFALHDTCQILIEFGKFTLLIFSLAIGVFFCRYSINKSLKKSGGLYTDSQIIEDYFVFQPEKRAFDVKVDIPDISAENPNNLKFTPATQEEADHVAQMHRAAYSKTVWGADVEVIKKRNIAHLKKHSECIMLIKPTGWEEDFGFTHMVAVSQKTWYRFEQGDIGCAELTAREIAPLTENPNLPELYGLILISAAMNPENKKLNDKKDSLTHDQIGRYLIQAIAYHIDQYLIREFRSQATVPVMFQTIRPKLITTFIKGQNPEQLKYSKEQARIVTFDVNNIHCNRPEDCFCIG